jgi:hypothetical protein
MQSGRLDESPIKRVHIEITDQYGSGVSYVPFQQLYIFSNIARQLGAIIGGQVIRGHEVGTDQQKAHDAFGLNLICDKAPGRGIDSPIDPSRAWNAGKEKDSRTFGGDLGIRTGAGLVERCQQVFGNVPSFGEQENIDFLASKSANAAEERFIPSLTDVPEEKR